MDDFYEKWLSAAVDPEKEIAEMAQTVGSSTAAPENPVSNGASDHVK